MRCKETVANTARKVKPAAGTMTGPPHLTVTRGFSTAAGAKGRALTALRSWQKGGTPTRLGYMRLARVPRGVGQRAAKASSWREILLVFSFVGADNHR